MTKKHYIKIADIIKSEMQKEQTPDTMQMIDNLIFNLSEYFKADNPNFDKNKFADYIYN
jgi:hypothetical protein